MTKALWAALRLSTATVGYALLLASSALATVEDEAATAASDRFNSISASLKKYTQQTEIPNPTPFDRQLLNFSSPNGVKIRSTAPKKATFKADAYPMSTQVRESQLTNQQTTEMPALSCTSDSSLQDADSSNSDTDESSDCLDQITSVSQLSDVQPTDWAFSALQSLVERYGAIAGYPDATFRGNRPMTRYEFAAGLNAAIEKIAQLIATDPTNLVSKEDLVTLERLSAEFAAELSTVRGRADSLEARTEELEANQFSTTTKLNATISFNMAAATAGRDVKVERIDPTDIFSAAQRGVDGKPIVSKVEETPSVTFSQIVGLFLTTSFTGNDLLVTTLAAGNGASPPNFYTSAGLYNTFGVSGLDITPTVTANDLGLIELYYSFPLSPSLLVAVGPRMLWQRYFDTNTFTSSFGRGASGFNTFGSTLVNEFGRGGGAVVLWRVSEQFDLRVGYVASPDGANPTKGLFNGTNAFTTQLTYSPSRNINIRLIYDRSKLDPVAGQIRTRPIIGVADDGVGGAISDATANSFGVNFDWLVNSRLGVFGRYTYANTHLDPATDGVSDGNVKAQSVQIGVAFPDIGKKGAMATLSYVVPFSVLDGRRFLVAGGGDGGTQYDIEATYYFPLTDNIAIIPAFHLIGNPNNFSDNPNIYTGTVRAQFSF